MSSEFIEVGLGIFMLLTLAGLGLNTAWMLLNDEIKDLIRAKTKRARDEQ